MVQFLKHPWKLVVLFLSIILLCACSFGQPITPLKISPSPTSPNDGINVYFTDPGGGNAVSHRGGPDSVVAASIDQARLSVDAALYDLNLWSIRDALIHAHNRGVSVRIVTESDNIDRPEIQALKDAGIEVLGDRREGLMHNKFIIIDRFEVWTGSMNYTLSDTYDNYNNLLQVKSIDLAENYTTEFEEMFLNDLFGPDIRSATPHPEVKINGNFVEVYFSPDDHVAQHIIQAIQGARKNISFQAFSFTSDEIAQAILERASAGITVRGVFDQSQVESNTGGEYERLHSKGLDVRLLDRTSLLHDKLIIIDDQIVITGSYNFSRNAEINNDENILIIHDPEISQLYTDRFFLIYQDLTN